jgi:hypothetical protein
MRDVNISQHSNQRVLWLKRWIAIYFWLLIFEGVLRKWILPELSGPLLIVRDPVALIICIQASRCGKFSQRAMMPFVILTLAMLLLAIAQIVADVNTVWIALYGLRSYVLHLPLAIVMAKTLTGEDIRKFGRWLLMLSVPMTALILAQFYAPAHSWLNAGAGEGSSQFLATGAHVRPAGTFSFGVGAQCFTVLVAVFVLYALTRPRIYPRWLLWPATMATIASVPLLGSRTVAFEIAVLLGFTLLSGVGNVARIASIAKVVAVLILATILASHLPFFEDSTSTFTKRWQEASRNEGDTTEVLNLRVLGVFDSGIKSGATTPWLGNGIGMGSNFAAYLKTGSTSEFPLAEMEWERVVLEFGPFFGLAFMGLRVGFAAYMLLVSIRAMKRNETLSWLLLPAVLPLLILTIMEQPTYLGFMVFGSGLCLAAARSTRLSRSPASAYAVPDGSASLHASIGS